MTAHPIELIAGLGDGIDLDQKDQVMRHIDSCDLCRNTARTMRRIDGLIAQPEPVLPLPARSAPHERQVAPRWASIAAVGLTLVVVIGVTVASWRQAQLRQTQVLSADACGVLTAAAHATGFLALSVKADTSLVTWSFAQALPPRIAGSWTACEYRDGPHTALLLYRTSSTARSQVDALLADAASGDRMASALGKELTAWGDILYGRLIPRVGDTSADRWLTSDPSRPGEEAMLVFAEPYFFAIITARGDANPLADAIVAELGGQPQPPLSGLSKIDACGVIMRVQPFVGIRPESLSDARRHWAEMSRDRLTSIGMSENVCQFWEANGEDQHVWIREQPTTPEQATTLLPIVSRSLFPGHVGEWVQVDTGMWLAHGQWLAVDFSACAACPIDYTVVAVLDQGHFVALTRSTDEAAIQTARAVLAEVERP